MESTVGWLPVIYDWLVHKHGLSERWYFVVVFGTFMLATISFWHMFYTIFCYKLRWFERYKVNRFSSSARFPRERWNHAIKVTTFNFLVITPVLLYFGYDSFAMRGTDMRAALPPWPELAIHVLVAMFVDDTGFYWNHRLLHHPRLYKHVHKMHHEFKNVAWFTAAYAHPIEFFMSSIPSSVGPLITGAPLSAILFWQFFRLWEAIDEHSGYIMPWSPWNLLPSIQDGSDRHDFHHSHNKGNYGSLFTFWDWICGTDTAYNNWKAGHRQNQPGPQSDLVDGWSWDDPAPTKVQ
eukprot:m.62187 g.62187  ORF g.62187 m.62187 type:complete len:293 (-) comp11899_c0_seq1:288-1166(-)